MNKDKIKDKFTDNNNKIKNAPITKVNIYIYQNDKISMPSNMRKRIRLNLNWQWICFVEIQSGEISKLSIPRKRIR